MKLRLKVRESAISWPNCSRRFDQLRIVGRSSRCSRWASQTYRSMASALSWMAWIARASSGTDAFAIEAFRHEAARGRPRLALVYLPGLDILGAALSESGRSVAERVALAKALGDEARSVAAFLSGPDVLGGDASLAVVVLDGGRSSRGGEVLLAGPLAAPGGAEALRPVDLAPTLLALLGVPASREVEGRVDLRLVRAGTASVATVASWGRKRGGGGPVLDPREYVENLRSLGYLR